MSKELSIAKIALDTSSYERSIKQAQKVWGDFTKAIGTNAGKLSLAGAAIGAIATAAKVMGDAFKNNESIVDDWGKTVKAAEGLYNGFLNALNTGDISGYLSRMSQIVTAAKKAYEEMDKLGTLKTIQTPEMAKQESENTRLRLMIQTGRWISPMGEGYDPWGMNNGDKLNAEQIRAIEKQLQDGMNDIVSLTKRELEQTDAAIEEYYKSLAIQNGMSLQEFKEGTSTWEAFSEKLDRYSKYLKFEQEHTTTTPQSTQYGVYYQRSRDNAINPFADALKWGVFRVDKMGENSFNDLTNRIQQRESLASQLYSTIGQTYRVINRAEGTTVRDILNGGSGGSGGGDNIPYIPLAGSIDAQTKRVKELNEAFNQTAEQGIRDSLLPQLKAAQSYLEAMKNGGPGLAERPQDGLSSRFTPNASEEIKPIAVDNSEKINGIIQSWNTDNKEKMLEMKAITGSVSGIFAGVQKMGIELPEELSAVFGVMQGISTILTSILTITTLIKAEQTGDNILGGVIGLFGGLFGFSHGGIVKAANGMLVPGNSFSGDNLRMPILGGNGWVGINSGELILSRSQQDSIAAQLQDGGGRNIQVYGRIQGEDIILAADRAGQRRGYGQLMFGKNL